MKELLKVKDLCVSFATQKGNLVAIDHLNFGLMPGECLGVVGESGSGKSVTSLAIMNLLPDTGKISSGDIFLGSKNLRHLSEKQMLAIRGADIAMIFQDPMTSLNPCYTVGFQILETLKFHVGGTRKELLEKAVKLLDEVGIAEPKKRMEAYPHQLSGGMSQRVMIAMAIASNPKVLIADEPTTALDVTVQAQILNLLKKLQVERGMAVLLISHDIGVIAQHTDRILVMYAGQAVETGLTSQVITSPQHPYTKALLASLPSLASVQTRRLPILAGLVPDLAHRPTGCQFHPRCKFSDGKRCVAESPEFYTTSEKHAVRCLAYAPQNPLPLSEVKGASLEQVIYE